MAQRDPRIARQGDASNRVTAEAGVSNKAFYRYFAGKDELILAVMERGIAIVVSYLQHQMAKENRPEDRVARWIEGTLAQVAKALGVGIDYFIVTPRAADSVTRAAGRMRFAVNGSSIEYERLGAEFPGNELSCFIMHVPAGFHSETVSHEGEEIIYVLDGSITQVVDGTSFYLTEGDSLHYRGTSPHSYFNASDRPTRILWAGTLTLFHTPGAAAFSPPLRAETGAAPATSREKQ